MRAALVEAGLELALPDDVDLQRVHRLRQGGAALAGVLQPARQVGHGAVGARQARARLFGQQSLGAQLLAEVVDFLLACQHAILFGVGGVEAHARGAHDVALAGDEGAARRQRGARRKCAGGIVGNVDVVQPVEQHAAQSGVVNSQQAGERRQPGHGGGNRAGRNGNGRRVQRQPGRRRVAEKSLDPVDVRHFERHGALAQHRFQRGFPALFDVQLLPQPRQRFEFVLVQPRLHLALGLHALLQLPEGRKARLEPGVGARFNVDLSLRAGTLLLDALLLSERFFEHHRLLFERLLLFFELQAQVGQLSAVGQVKPVFFLLQALAPDRQSGEDARGVTLVRRRQLDLPLRR